VYVSLWTLFVLVVIFGVICAVTGFPASATSAVVLYICVLLAASLIGIAQAVVGQRIQTKVASDLGIPSSRRFPVRTLLNKRDFDRWAATLHRSE
jgi:hypothetical protein